MRYSTGVFISVCIIALILATGCTSPAPQEPPAVPSPTSVVVTEKPSAELQAAEMALQPADLPSDYILRDRSVMISPDVSQLSRDLGWMQGYFVLYDRMGRLRSDHTRIRQSISIFPVENMRKVYSLEKLTFTTGDNSMRSPNEIPFPAIGDQSMAYRVTDLPESGQITYTVIFTKKNVFERITMAGTSTDYEAFKEIAQKAAAKIR